MLPLKFGSPEEAERPVMINTTCPLCPDNETSSSPVIFDIKKDAARYRIKRCPNCRHIYTWFDHEVAISSYYDEGDYTVQDTRNSIFHKIQELEYGLVLKKIRKLKPKASNILDFGCGKGIFLQLAKEKGFEVKGIESSLPRANYAITHFNLDINTSYYTSGSVFNRKFDVFTMFHVLEHIQLPENLLHNLINDNLKDDGIFVVEVPNFNSWQSKWSGNKWLHLDVPRHISHFTPEVLQQLMAKNNCHVLTTSYFSFHLGIVGMVQTIFSWFGYKGFLIAALKRKKTPLLLLSLFLVLPFAFILEVLAAATKNGGVMRLYAIKQSKS